MAIDFRNVVVEEEEETPPSGTKVFTGEVSFGREVRRATTAIKSFRLDYKTFDHHINVIEVASEVINTPGNIALFRVLCRYADQNFDDKYTARFELLVIADVV